MTPRALPPVAHIQMSKKRKSPLPTLSKKPLDVEEVDGLTLYLGGTHGYKKVKLLRDGYQGYDNKKKLYTGCFDTAIEAAIALARKERDADLRGRTLTRLCL